MGLRLAVTLNYGPQRGAQGTHTRSLSVELLLSRGGFRAGKSFEEPWVEIVAVSVALCKLSASSSESSVGPSDDRSKDTPINIYTGKESPSQAV